MSNYHSATYLLTYIHSRRAAVTLYCRTASNRIASQPLQPMAVSPHPDDRIDLLNNDCQLRRVAAAAAAAVLDSRQDAMIIISTDCLLSSLFIYLVGVIHSCSYRVGCARRMTVCYLRRPHTWPSTELDRTDHPPRQNCHSPHGIDMISSEYSVYCFHASDRQVLQQ